MALNDIYQVKLNQAYLGQVVLNVHFYKAVAVGIGAGAPLLATRFQDSVADNYLDAQINEVEQTSIEVVNLRDLADFNTLVYAPGSRDGDDTTALGAPASYVAYSLRNPRGGPGQRNGYKRVVGVALEHMSGNDLDPAGAAYIAIMDVLADRIGINLDSGLFSFQPVIVKRPIVFGTNPAVVRVAGDWFRDGFVTQRSRGRKYAP